MKRTFLLTLLLALFFTECNKEAKPLTEQEKNEAAIKGKWKLLQLTDSLHRTYTNADPCFADDTFEFGNGSATLSQGACVEFPTKEKVLTFSWNFLSADVVNMGGDTVKILVENDSALVFRREDPQFLEYHWYR